MTGRLEIEALPAALDGQRIDRVVALVASVSRSEASALLGAGRVAIDGEVVEKASTRVEAGSGLVVDVPPTERAVEPEPEVELTIVHADPDVLVLDKAAGLVVHPGSGVRSGTVVNGLLARYPELASVGPDERPGIVHRLDRGTSGLLMVARTEDALSSLSDQLRARTVDRRYRTVVEHHVEADRGVVDAPLGRSSRDATRRAVVADGRPARTHYEVVRRNAVEGEIGTDATPPVTELVCRLETGRTHQIRAHLAAIGHPVVGDERYGASTIATVASSGLQRPFLHAETLGFDHPRTGERLSFHAPLPPDLVAAGAALFPPPR